MDDLAKALWVKLKLAGGDTAQRWRRCVVCGAPTQLTWACQQTPDTMGLPLPPLEKSPSGRDCWTERRLFADREQLEKLVRDRIREESVGYVEEKE